MGNCTTTGSRTFYNGIQLVVATNWLKVQNKIGNRHEGLCFPVLEINIDN